MTTRMTELEGCCIFLYHNFYSWPSRLVLARRSSDLRGRRDKHFVILGLLENCRSPLRTKYSRCCRCLPEKSPQGMGNICSDHLNCRISHDCRESMKQRMTGLFCCYKSRFRRAHTIAPLSPCLSEDCRCPNRRAGSRCSWCCPSWDYKYRSDTNGTLQGLGYLHNFRESIKNRKNRSLGWGTD